MMRKLSTILAATLLFMGSISCKKWLDVKPTEEILAEEVLTDTPGFTKALSGIYHHMGHAELYGRELEFGMMDVLAGYWRIEERHEYYEIYKFNYLEPGVQQKLSAIWSQLYKVIHECNVILEHVDQIKTDPAYELIKGEALGLRAFLHFEVLKLFGPIIKQKGLDTRAIPYYTSSTKKAQSFLTSRACLDQIENDLIVAKQLLSKDPIQTHGREADGNEKGTTYNSLLDRRGIHMNYYAVMALLARKSQWEGNDAGAILHAEELIRQLKSSKAVRFIEPTDLGNVKEMTGEEDIRFTKENIWGLYVNDLIAITAQYHYEAGWGMKYKALIPEYTYFLKKLYEDGTGSIHDIRVINWKISDDFVYKFTPFNKEMIKKDTFFEVQLINLPEIYFILVEAYLERDLEKAMEYLNVVRQHRSLQPIQDRKPLTKNSVLNHLIDEVRREYIGEGYLFSYYKHLNHAAIRRLASPAPSEKIFVFPVPTEETIYNPNF